MTRPLLPAALAILLAACGDATTAPPADAAVDAVAVVDVPVAQDVPVDVPHDHPDVPPAPFPAFIPPVPVVANSGGPVLAAPHMVPVFITDPGIAVDPEVARIADFLAAYAVSDTWHTQMSEYGVGAGTVAPSLHVDSTGLAAGTVQSTRLASWLLALINNGTLGTPDANTLYVLMLDGSRQVQAGTGRTCQNIGGYHADLRSSGLQRIAYAVIPDCGQGTDGFTRVLSHEIVEAATDPYPNTAPAYAQPSTQTPPEGAWAVAYSGGEVGDMCEQRTDAVIRPTDVGYSVQRTWSNAAALAGLDPCVPASPAAPYFNAVPTLTDTLSLPGRDQVHPISSYGVTMAVGESRVLEVRLFSTHATAEPIRVIAREVTTAADAAPAFHFTWDHLSGVNGDVLHLTIHATAEAPEGRVFQVVSTVNGYNNNWVGAVATE